MKRFLAILLVTGLVGSALAQGPPHREAPRLGMTARSEAQQAELQQQGRHGPSHLGAHMRGALHEALGLPEEEIHARKEDGASIASIAAEQGVGRAALEAAFLAARAAAITTLLEAGTISELQAERMVERGVDVFATVVDREGLGGGQHMTGELRLAQRTDTPRGPQAQTADVRRHPMTPQRRGPHWERSD